MNSVRETRIVKPNLVIVVSGPSGAGKSTICQRFVAGTDASLVVSCTTRPRREGEEAGRDYIFISREDFEVGIGEGRFLEYAEVHGNLYGTPRDQVDAALSEGRDTILEIDVQGGLQVKQHMPEAVLVFVRTGSFGALERRLVGRGTDAPDVIDIRLRNALRELEVMDRYDYFLLNDSLDQALTDFRAIVTAEKCRVARLGRRVESVVQDCRVPSGADEEDFDADL